MNDFACPECNVLHSGPRLLYKGLPCCKECYALFLSINRALMGAKF